jgi:hypothetical protein
MIDCTPKRFTFQLANQNAVIQQVPEKSNNGNSMFDGNNAN